MSLREFFCGGMTMRILELHPDDLGGREQIHDFFQKGLALPEWYGRNLDALFDVLTDLSEETRVVVHLPDAREESEDPYVRLLLCVLRDASRENDRLTWEVLP